MEFMAEHAEVFVSATTADLGSYRREIKDALLTLGIFPVEQSNFALAYGRLTKVLHDLIGRCDAVVHLVGFHYGAEPAKPRPGQPRRSYTQMEYYVARELQKPIFLFLAAENYEADERQDEPEEQKELQLAHRQVIKNCGDVYVPFANRDIIRTKVRELRFPARSSAAPRRVVNLPSVSLGPLFKGRDTVLAELFQRLGSCGKSVVKLTGRQAIHGLGGVGKTRLAIEYAWRHASDYKDALLFVSARSAVDLRANLSELCNPLVLNLREWNQPEEIGRLAAVFRWLSENPGWLLIIDNADTPEAAAEVGKILPQLRNGAVIITSRIGVWGVAVQSLELDVLAEEDAAGFLLERTESRRKKMLIDKEAAAAIARDVGGLALALEQAGAYIAKLCLSLWEYRRRWESRKGEVLAWYDERVMLYPESVATTWQTTIKELSEPERKLFNILAWFAPEPIPLSLLERNIVDGAEARDALAGLASWSLARWMADGEGFAVHRLVQEITRQRLSHDQKRGQSLNARLQSWIDVYRRPSGTQKAGSCGTDLPRTAAFCSIT